MASKSKQEITVLIFSFLLAFVMWIYAMAAKNPPETETVNNIPVQIMNIEALKGLDYTLSPDQIFTVNLDIRGKALDVYSAKNPNFFNVIADLNSVPTLKIGENTIPIEVISKPSGITVENPNGTPYYVKIKLEALQKKSVPVEITLLGNVKTGYGYLDAIKKPTEILITGPETLVNSVTNIVGQISINDKISDANAAVSVKPVDKNGNEVKNVTLEDSMVEVTVPIKPAKEVEVVLKTKGKVDENKILKKIIPSVKKVIILGDRKYLDKVNEIETFSYDISNINTTFKDIIALNLPEGIDVFKGLNTVEVEFVVENKLNNAFKIPISLSNEKSDYNYTTSITDINVSVTGAESILNSLNADDVIATVDVSNLDEGLYTLPIKITLPNGVEITKSTQDKLTVTISKTNNNSN